MSCSGSSEDFVNTKRPGIHLSFGGREKKGKTAVAERLLNYVASKREGEKDSRRAIAAFASSELFVWVGQRCGLLFDVAKPCDASWWGYGYGGYFRSVSMGG